MNVRSVRGGAAFQMDILGTAGTIAAFNFFSEKTKKKLIRSALRKAGEPILKTAKDRVPFRTGALYWNLGMRVKSSDHYLRTAAIIYAPTRKKLNIPKNAPGYYPAAMEFGFRARNGRMVPPRAYMRPAFYQNRGRAINIFKSEVREGTDRIARRAKNKFLRKTKFNARKRAFLRSLKSGKRSFRNFRRRISA